MFIQRVFLCILAVCAAMSALPVRAGEIVASPLSRKVVSTTSPQLDKSLKEKGLTLGNPLFFRIIKAPSPDSENLREGVLDVYIEKSGHYLLYKSYPICAASGTLGPKTKEGDNQAPEGFYYLTSASFNPWSSYHLSLNLGYPNAYDRAHGYTGDFLMIHGQCVSIGCYAMTDAGIDEIYTLAQAAMQNGQSVIRVHAFPFPMADKNMQKAKDSSHFVFWQNLKQGWDWFETRQSPPNVIVTGKTYSFSALPH